MSVLASTLKLEEKSDSKELKVLSYNLGIVAFFNKEKYTKRAKQFCDILKKENYDVVLLQEVWHRRHRDILNSCGNWSVVDLDKKSGLHTKVDSGLMIFSKYKLSNKKKFTFN